MNPNSYKTRYRGASKLHKNTRTRLLSRTGFRGLLLATGILALLVSGLSMLAAPPSNPALSLDQASNGGIGKTPVDPVAWENGNQNGQKAHYNEGQSIPYRARLTNLTPGLTYRATFGYDITHSSKHAIDFITSRQRIAEEVDPCRSNVTVQVSPCEEGTPGQIPTPGGAAAGFFGNVVAAEGAQFVSIFNGDIDVVEFMDQGNEALAQSETTFRVTFTVKPGQATVVLSWGGHIARQADWGAGQAATGISGSPYHTRAKSMDVPAAGGGFSAISIGNQDRALASSAVTPPAECIINTAPTAVCVGTTNTHSLTGTASTSLTYDWTLTAGEGTVAHFGTVDEDPSDGTISAQVITDAPGTYTIRLTQSNPGGSEFCEKTVTVSAQPTVNITTDGACNPMLTANASGGFNLTYQWTKDGVNFSTDQSITPIATGLYAVTVTSGGTGCNSASASVQLCLGIVSP